MLNICNVGQFMSATQELITIRDNLQTCRYLASKAQAMLNGAARNIRLYVYLHVTKPTTPGGLAECQRAFERLAGTEVKFARPNLCDYIALAKTRKTYNDINVFGKYQYFNIAQDFG